MKHKICVVDGKASDSMEDWVLGDMIADTAQPFMEWSRQYPDDAVTFSKEISVSDYGGLRVQIFANIDDDAIAGHFVLEHGHQPLKELTWKI